MSKAPMAKLGVMPLLTASLAISNGITPSFAIGALDITLT